MFEQIYCSVDLEFTGFDVTRDQILEIGFAFFRMTENGPEITEEWSQVFKPSIEVHPKIFGLTGITQEELDEAPEFAEHRAFLQEKLRNAIIVGHNPVMDIKFLEAYGIKLSGKTIDTLELVQFILPTHHSYNLENLMHYFGVAHESAHRALGDCRTTISVLIALLQVYQNFNTNLKQALQEVIARGNFEWAGLLDAPLNTGATATTDSLQHLEYTDIEPLPMQPGITIDPQINSHEARIALGAAQDGEPVLLAVASTSTVMRLWKSKLAHGLFSPSDMFSKEAFEMFAQNAQTGDELRFCLKILVWLHTNWQTETVLDLNISFFGGQFRSFIVGGEMATSNEQVAVCDYRALHYATQQNSLKNRTLVVCDIQGFEKYISSGNDTKLAWNSMLYTLRLIYNPETNFGSKALKDKVITALIGVDLYFGLVYLLLHKAYPHLPYVDLAKVEAEQPHIYRRLQRGAQSLMAKLREITDPNPIIEMQSYVRFLEQFFTEKEGRVRWIMIDEQNTTFHDQPLEVSSDAQNILKQFPSKAYTETITSRSLLSYYAERLGLNNELSDIKLDLTTGSSRSIIFETEPIAPTELIHRVVAADFPVVMVMPDQIAVKQFYNDHYQQLKKSAAVFAQGYSGGGNKMFRNFSLRKQSILVATADFIARQNHNLSVRTVLFVEPPPLELTHPYIQALIIHWQEQYPQLSTLLVQAKLVEVLKKVSVDPALAVHLYPGVNRPAIADIFSGLVAKK